MMKGKYAIIPVLTAVLILWGCSTDSPTVPTKPGVAEKNAEHFTISGTVDIPDEVIDMGEWMYTPSGVTHMAGYTFPAILAGDLAGDAIFVQNGHWNPNYTGGLSGDFDLAAADLLGQTGSIRGQFASSLHFGWLDGTAAMHGYDGLDGYHLVFNLVGPLGGPYTYTAEVTVDAGN